MVKCFKMEPLIPRLRGMYWLMSFVGSIGVLLKNSSLVLWLQCAFTGVPKMLTGKKFPMKVCLLRFIMLELLRGFVVDVTSFDKLQEKRDTIFQENILTEYWEKHLTWPVFLMMLFIQTGQFPLHFHASRSHISLLQEI